VKAGAGRQKVRRWEGEKVRKNKNQRQEIGKRKEEIGNRGQISEDRGQGPGIRFFI
jgi:hypothetical protein